MVTLSATCRNPGLTHADHLAASAVNAHISARHARGRLLAGLPQIHALTGYGVVARRE
jgi:hypothetical protein